MLSTIFRTTRQSPNYVFYLLHILFLLHICTAFSTLVNALNNNDNEAIIQLSIDSIHVVKSSDPRFANIEENANDNEEKELLIALLTSFDDDYKNPKQIPMEKSSELEDQKEISIPNNCTTATASSSSIRFIPSLLDFGEQSIAIARMQTVLIINDDSEPLELHSLSGTTVQFYSSFFTQKTLSANGGNTTINVYYLPRTVGSIKSTITIKTNRGNLHYYVNGIGISNPFHIRPLIGAIVPLNSTYEYLVHFYNPYNYSMDINEIYTSDENLIIELFSFQNSKTKISTTFEHQDEWHFEPYRMRPIMKINYFAHKLDRLHGFYCIKTNTNDTIIVPVEINVSDRESLFSNVDLIEFSWHGLIHSTAKFLTVPVYVINNGRYPVTISDVRVTSANANYVTVHHEKVQVPSGIHHLTKIAELTIHPQSIPKDIKRLRGSVQIYTTNNIEPTLQVPFRASVIHGSIGYERETTLIYIPSSSSVDSSTSNEKKKDECRPIKFFNQFNLPLIIYNATTDKPELLSQYIKMNVFTPFIYAKPGQLVHPVCINILKQSLSSAPFANLEATLTLHTNLSFFHLPIYLYSGLLSLDLVIDSTNGGIKRNDTNPLEYFLASIPVNVSRTVKFILINANPIDISIEQIAFTLPKANLQLIEMQTLDGSETNVAFKRSYRKENIVKLVIPARHRTIFALTINGTSDPSFYHETITFKTRYETLNMNVKYRIISGSIELEAKQPLHIDVFPSRAGVVDISIHNQFDEPTDILRIEFPAYGKCFSFLWNSTAPGKLIIEANQTYRIGKLTFDMIPLCNSIQIPSESTCYCGLNNHPEFKQRWEQHVSALNSYELDHTLVTKFRGLWKEWTTLVRKHRLHTNIWLITDQANVTWPVSIGFVWPSVLEHMSSTLSRAPIILDFHLTLIDTPKTQNVIITNPSSSILQYAVELTSTVDNIKTKKQGTNNNQLFDIATTSKRVEVSDDVYRFNLLPSEHIIFTASYRPRQSAKHEMYLVVRNNLTIIESILLRGEGGSGSLTVGNRKAGSSDIPLVLEMNEKQYKLCSNIPSAEGTRGNPVLQKIVTLRNTGNMKAIIHEISFGQSKCSGQGFSVNECTDIEIEPNDKYDLRIRFQPDYTIAEIAETLTLNTNIGRMTFPLIVRIPQRILATCYQTIPRPIWEARVYYLCLCAILIILLYVLTVAVYEAQRLFNDYLARAELRSRIPIISPTLVDLADLTAAVQDEQKTRERIESRSSTSSVINKKEPAKEETKPKDNELKAKRSNPTVINGSKDNGETLAKPLKTPEGSNTPVRPVATSPKPVSHKSRRATTDNGPTKSSKHQPETPIKQQTLRLQKSTTSEQSSVVISRSPTPSSTVSSIIAVSDNESEPFMIARPKRVSAKTKEATTTNSVSVKSSPNADGAVSTQLSPSPPVPPPLPPPPPPPPPSITTTATALPKLVARTDLSEQRQHHQEVPRPTDTSKDKQWQMVSSNRGLRKGMTTTPNRRETTEESQTTGKSNKSTSNNHDFGRYVSQTEAGGNETNDTNDWIPSSTTTTTANDIPLFMPIPTTPIMPTNVPQKLPIPTTTIRDDVGRIPFPQHGPGPIQRPNKLTCPPAQPTYLMNSIQSPGTPDVLDQISRLINHQNSASTAVTPNVNNSSMPISDLSTPNLPWTTFSSAEWPPKYESTWPLTNIQSPTVSLTNQAQNPFALISAMNEQPGQPTREEATVWSSALGTATPRLASTSARTQRASTWNELFQSTVPSSAEATRPLNGSMLKYWYAPDPSSTDVVTSNGHVTEAANPFWSMGTPSMSNQAQMPPTAWWPNASSDENNNKSQTNHHHHHHLGDDSANNRDQSRWDFAR